jgi:hypothetical protein
MSFLNGFKILQVIPPRSLSYKITLVTKTLVKYERNRQK